ncbi:hypothetical protein FRAHR75_120009 [Frankia sp. Hr75.2]|nr:hypothetical protein FRAHR75_120009 [Frankia sp. Hr75.2]
MLTRWMVRTAPSTRCRLIAASGVRPERTITRRLVKTFAARTRPPTPPGLLDELTPREHEVLVLVARPAGTVDEPRRADIPR